MLSSSWFKIYLYKVWFRVGLGFEYPPDDNANLLDIYIYTDIYRYIDIQINRYIDLKIYRYKDVCIYTYIEI